MAMKNLASSAFNGVPAVRRNDPAIMFYCHAVMASGRVPMIVAAEDGIELECKTVARAPGDDVCGKRLRPIQIARDLFVAIASDVSVFTYNAEHRR
jgi:hypothetical protein